jgi:hypothetical protein
MGIGLVSGIGLFIIAQLKMSVPNGSGTGRIQNPFHFPEPFPDKQVIRGFSTIMLQRRGNEPKNFLTGICYSDFGR